MIDLFYFSSFCSSSATATIVHIIPAPNGEKNFTKRSGGILSHNSNSNYSHVDLYHKEFVRIYWLTFLRTTHNGILDIVEYKSEQ